MESRFASTDFSCPAAILSCFLLLIIYVASLYIWNSPYNRKHPSTIKRRFFSVFIIALISPLPLYLTLDEKTLQKATIWELLGLRWSGLIQATIIPLLLTMVLFLGPLSMQLFNEFWRLYTDCVRKPSLESMDTLIWWRNYIVAPLSEEWTFRACMLPLLLRCFTSSTAICVCPLFFGIGHFHHIIERVKMGMQVKHALLMSCFQFLYTTLFGAYAAFLFIKTGHFVAPFAVHSFCNHMGFPDFSEIAAYKNPLKRAAVLSLFIAGLFIWCFLLTPLTDPALYHNDLF